MTREDYIKICKVCENRKHDYAEGLVCSLTGKIADFQDTCPNFVSDNEAVLNSIKKENETEQKLNELLENKPEESPWRMIVSVILIVLAVLRLILALSR